MDYAVIGLPRSGTTWAANWLMTDVPCYHDPIARMTIRQIFDQSKRFGISCSGIYKLSKELNEYPCPKVILHRGLSDINRSLTSLGLPPMTEQDEITLSSINGYHVNYCDLFDTDKAWMIWNTLKPDATFDKARHEELCSMHIQPEPYNLGFNSDAFMSYVKLVEKEMKNVQAHPY